MLPPGALYLTRIELCVAVLRNINLRHAQLIVSLPKRNVCRSTEQDSNPDRFVVGVFRFFCQDVNMRVQCCDW